MARIDPHDPGVEPARKRAEEAGDVAREPTRLGTGSVRFGIASWTDPTMTVPGVFYPKGLSTAEERLRYYASQFPMVEVDATYYALPNKRTSESWVERTPEGFVFDIKAHALMTGQPTEVARLPKAIKEELPSELTEKKRIYRKDMPSELLDAVYGQFREALEPLIDAKKLGAIFVQFPKWVFPSNEARELILETRQRLELPIAVEFRHGSWFNEKNAERTIRFLQDNKIPYVAVDEPQGFKSSVPPVIFPTNDELAVLRFHGRNKDNWEKKDITPSERFRYLYDEDELADWTPKIAAIAKHSKQTHVVYNNCYSNYGTTNAREAARLLAEMQA
ncbi:MAG TPA: DUF72 domain-containing protein [Candidatus Dormibacteraeota bacterium]|nr:DUF72 domain-containing protein [Candidatus Dormibacteraeota bacterium]